MLWLSRLAEAKKKEEEEKHGVDANLQEVAVLELAAKQRTMKKDGHKYNQQIE